MRCAYRALQLTACPPQHVLWPPALTPALRWPVAPPCADAEEEYEDGYGAEYGEEGAEGGGEEVWAPDPARVQHMRSALMIQRAACLDLVGEKAFNEL